MDTTTHQSSERFFVAARLSCSSRTDAFDSNSDPQALAGLRDRIAQLVDRHGARVVLCSEKEVVCVFTELLNAVDATRSAHQGLLGTSSGDAACLSLGLFEPNEDTLDERARAAAIDKARQLARLTPNGHTLACVREFDRIDQAVRCAEHEVDLDQWYDDSYPGRVKAQRILWQDESPTRLAIAGSSACPVTRVERLLLRWRDQRLVVDKDSGPVTMGRGGSSIVAIESDFASRNHARLDYVHSCFVLLDCSTNGTYVNIGENEFYLHDDELILRGKGSISLGRRPSSSGGQLVYFTAEAAQNDSPARGGRP